MFFFYCYYLQYILTSNMMHGIKIILFQGGKQGSPHMSRRQLEAPAGPAGMIGGAHLPSAALLHEAKLGEIFLIFLPLSYFYSRSDLN